jgi:hypothetical protein
VCFAGRKVEFQFQLTASGPVVNPSLIPSGRGLDFFLSFFRFTIPCSYHFPVVKMAPESLSSDAIATPAADSSAKQCRSVAKRRSTFKRMIYGFAFSPDELEEWGRQQYGDTDDEKVLLNYISKSMGPLFRGCYRLWRRTTKHFVTYYTGPRRHESDWCITFADNISRDTATPPSREIIDMMKENLHIQKEPQWYRFYGD